MMTIDTALDTTADREIKVCCAAFYQSDIVRMLLGGVFHPGGLALTRHLGEAIGLGPGDHVLDVACGRGASAVHLAERFGCRVTGLDYGAENIAAAEAHAAESGVTHLMTFRQGDAEALPFGDGTFEAVISECSFCTFPDKATAAAEMARVLRPKGRLGLTDMTVNGPLPDDVQSLLAWVACVAGAGSSEEYVAMLRAAGLADFIVEDQQDALLDMVADLRRKLLGVELAAGLGRLDLGDPDLNEGKRLARRAVELIEDGTVGYALIIAKKRG
jgi:SAM-dependent methyltransferase